MTTFTLIEKFKIDVQVGKNTKQEEVYHYQNDTGEQICLRWHSTAAWTVVFIAEKTTMSNKRKMNKFVDAWAERMFEAHDAKDDSLMNTVVVK